MREYLKGFFSYCVVLLMNTKVDFVKVLHCGPHSHCPIRDTGADGIWNKLLLLHFREAALILHVVLVVNRINVLKGLCYVVLCCFCENICVCITHTSFFLQLDKITYSYLIKFFLFSFPLIITLFKKKILLLRMSWFPT